ncbi:MAG: hypothetical protein IJC07_00690 [Clostridia bacterium]|nr:hypothetical protein [Clostridia bacterium]
MKFIRIILSVILVFCSIFTFTFGWKKISATKLDDKSAEYQGILNVWHVDGFEGGVGSRRQFLLNRAIEFEKQNSGVLVMVSNFTFEGINERLAKGEYPDLISFSLGVNVDRTLRLDCKNLSNGGFVGDKAYATAWCRGGYVLIANASKTISFPDHFDSITVSQAEYTEPLVAFVLEGFRAKKVSVKKPIDAYYDFVNGNTDYLLGTQRDLIRLNNRNFDVAVRPLKEFNDLIQYVAITTDSEQKNFYAQKFVRFLTEESTQKKLDKIGMFSCYYSVGYDNAHYLEMEKVKTGSTLSAFISSVQLLELQDYSKSIALGEKDDVNKIKNMLV